MTLFFLWARLEVGKDLSTWSKLMHSYFAATIKIKPPPHNGSELKQERQSSWASWYSSEDVKFSFSRWIKDSRVTYSIYSSLLLFFFVCFFFFKVHINCLFLLNSSTFHWALKWILWGMNWTAATGSLRWTLIGSLSSCCFLFFFTKGTFMMMR